MSQSPFAGRKLFTPEEANRALPLVRAITQDLADLSQEVMDRRERLKLLRTNRSDRHDDYSEELAQIEEELDKDNQRLHEYVEELQELGVELKNAPEGLVDFPALLEGRPVYLCWKLGEPEVMHWHDLETGYLGRQSLTAGSLAGDGPQSEGDAAE